MKIIIAIIFLVFLTSMLPSDSWNSSVTEGRDSKTASVDVQKYKKVSVCAIKRDPSKYNHQLLEINGILSTSYENFTLQDFDCESDQGIWLEYGGLSSSGTIICCDVEAKRARKKSLIVEKIPVP